MTDLQIKIVLCTFTYVFLILDRINIKIIKYFLVTKINKYEYKDNNLTNKINLVSSQRIEQS